MNKSDHQLTNLFVTVRSSAFLRAFGGGLILFALVFVTYWPSLRGTFFWDDHSLLADGVLERPLKDFWRYPPVLTLEEHFWPVTYSAFWFLRKVAGYDPFSFRFANILLHAANSVLLWQLLAMLRLRGAWLAAALFAVHPVHVESVAWIIELKDVLCAFFFLSAFSCYVKIDQAAPLQKRWPWIGAIVLFYVFASWSKSIGIVLPAIMLIVEWWRGNHRSLAGLALVGGLGLIGLILLWADYRVFSASAHTVVNLSWAERLELLGRAFWWYAAKLVWPTPLLAIYPKWSLGGSALAWLPTLLLAALLVGALVASYRQGTPRAIAAAVLAYFFLHLPTLGIVPHSFMAHSFVADRYQYLPSAVFSTLVGAGLAWLRGKTSQSPRWRAVTAGGVGIILTLYASATLVHASLYGNPEKLLRHTLTHNPAASTAHVMLGAILAQRGQMPEAAHHFRWAVRLTPDDLTARANLALTSWYSGDLGTVLEETSHVLTQRPDHAPCWGLRAAALAATGETTQALEAAWQALYLSPEDKLAQKVLEGKITSAPRQPLRP